MRRGAPSAAGILGLAFLLAACGSGGGPGSAPGTASSAPVSVPAATSDAPTATASAPESSWTSYKTADGKFLFDHPQSWNVISETEQTGQGVFVKVVDENETLLASLRTNIAAGSECLDKLPYSALDSVPLPALEQKGSVPRFVFETRTDVNHPDPAKVNVAAYGITSAPAPDGPTACPIFHFFTWPPSGAQFSGAYNPLAARPGLEMHVDTPQAYAETAEYRNIKKMITSLRPAT
ncbi:MAG: hypothetical protein ABIO34_04955 [Arthrobacter oryzae]